MNSVFVFYFLAALFLGFGGYMLIEAKPLAETGQITTFEFIMRGAGPLIMAVAMILFARNIRAKNGAHD